MKRFVIVGREYPNIPKVCEAEILSYSPVTEKFTVKACNTMAIYSKDEIFDTRLEALKECRENLSDYLKKTEIIKEAIVKIDEEINEMRG